MIHYQNSILVFRQSPACLRNLLILRNLHQPLNISDDEPIGDQVATVDNGLSPVSMATSEEGELDGTSDDEFEIEQSSDDDEQSDHEPEPGTYDQEEIDKEIAELLQELDSKYPEG